MRRILFFVFLGCSCSRLFGGVFFEHKKIGDLAFIRFIQTNDLYSFFQEAAQMKQFGIDRAIPYNHQQEFIAYYRNMFFIDDGGTSAYSYGDLTALSGDHSVDVMQLLQGLLTDAVFTGVPNSDVFKSLVCEMKNALAKQTAAMDKDKKEASYFFISYLLLANKDKSHFQRPPWDVKKMLSAINLDFIDSLDILITTMADKGNEDYMKSVRNFVDKSFLRLNNTAKYAILHLLALDQMRTAAHYFAIKKYNGFRLNLRIALITNAFADHFLQDAFAAGHMPVQRSPRGFDNKGVHDYYNMNGLDVHNLEGKNWRTYGDSHYDAITFERAIDANLASLNDLWRYFIETSDAYARGENVESSLYQKLKGKNVAIERMPDILIESFSAFRLMPVPLDTARYAEIALKRESKPGMYLEGGIFSYSNGSGPGWTVGFSPLSYVLSGYPSKIINDKIVSSKKEAKAWIGIGASYSAFTRDKFNVRKITGNLDLCFWDRLLVENRFGSIHENENYFVWQPAIGYEYKSLRSGFAPSVRLFHDVSKYPFAGTGLMIALRFY